MTTRTIPKNISKNEELVVVSKKEYAEFSVWQKTVKKYKTFVPTEAQKKALTNARNNRKKGIYLTFNGDIQKMKGEYNAWRKRIGAYRLFYEIVNSEKIIHVFNLERRSSNTY